MRSLRKDEQPQIPCNHGVDQSTDDLGAPIGAFRAANNMRIRGNGLLEKRAGTKGLAGSVSSTSSTAGRRITGSSSFLVDKPRFMSTVRELPLLATTSGKMFALDSGNPTERWYWQGNCSTAQPVRERFGAAMGSDARLGCAAVNARGYILTAAVQTDTTLQLRLESPDGAIIFAFPAAVTSPAKVKVIAVDEDFIVVRQSGTALGVALIDPDNPSVSFSSAGNLTSTAAYWDIDAFDGTHWYLVRQAGAAQAFINRFSGTSSVNFDSFSVTGTVPLSVFGDVETGRVWVGIYDDPTSAGTVRGRVWMADLSSPTAFTIASGAHIYGPPLLGRYRDYQSGGPSGTAALYAFRHVATLGQCGTMLGTINTQGTATSPQALWGVLPISKPDSYNRLWGLVTSQETTNEDVQRVALLRLGVDGITVREQPPTVELAAPNAARIYTVTPTGLYDLWQGIGNSTRTAATPTVRRSVFAYLRPLSQDFNNGAMMQLRVFEYETGEQRSHLDSLALGSVSIAAGQPTQVFGELAEMVSDGLGAPAAAEIGFAQTPTILSASSTSGVLAAGTYSVRAVYEWVDAYGARHLSAPSPPVQVTLNSTGGLSLLVTAGTVTQRPGNAEFAGNNSVRTLIYRTAPGGEVHHLDQRIYTNGGTSGTIAATVDGVGTGTLTEQEILYTEGGVQQNDLAPSCRFMCKSEDRLWCGGLWTPRIIQCSKILVPEEQPSFSEHPAFQVYLPDECTGLAYQDGQVVAFCARSIYLVSGDGPNDQGFGSFPAPRGYSQDLGCADPVSVLETRIGVLFKSQKGFYLIPRGFGPLQFIGSAIRDELETNGLTKVYAAAVHGGTISADRYGGHLARWLVGTEASTYATDVLTLDIDNGAWTRDTLDATAGRMLEMGAWPDGFAFMSSDLNADTNTRPIWYESGAYVGDGSDSHYIKQRLQTARYQPFGPLGQGHVKRVQVAMKAAPTLACQVTLSVTLDDGTPQTATWSIPTGGAPQYRELLPASPQLCSTLRIAVEDSALNGVMAPGVKLVALAFEADDSGGLRLLDSTERQ